MTLTKFLLARIAEDEEERYTAADPDRSPFTPARVLAECEAKRRIVALYLGFWEIAKNIGLDDPDAANVARNMYAGLYEALRALAVVYADHPDYRDEWRP